MKTRTLLVDSSYLIRRSITGAKDVYTKSFGHIGGLYQFMTVVRKMIKDHKINKVVLVWDGENGGIFRHRIDRAYKANRKTKEWYKKIELTEAQIRHEEKNEKSILNQKKRIREYAEELFFRQIEVDKIEGDDIIAQYCMDHNNIEEIFLYSNDRDFAQLLYLNITIIFPNISQPVTRSNYMMHFDHFFANALTLKIIEGDIGDNVKGIEGLKEKTLLKHIPELKYKKMSVREVCGRADDINKVRIEEKKKPLKSLENLINNVQRLRMNYKLVNLNEPLLNQEAFDALSDLELPLDPSDRGSKNLLRMMNEDEFLSVYGANFVQYVEPYYNVIMHEKDLLKEYVKNNRI